MPTSYNKTMLNLSEYVKDLSLAYIDSLGQDEKSREAIFAKQMVSIFYKYRNYLALMSKMHRRDLEDCLQTHKNKYLNLLANINVPENDISQYSFEIKEIIYSIKTHTKEEGLTRTEVDLLSQLIYKITYNAQILFAEQAHNHLAKDTILASAIVYRLNLLDSDSQNQLLDRLLLVKEIWNAENSSEITKGSIKYKFYHYIESFIEIGSINSIEAAFGQIVSFFVIKSNILENFSDFQLIHLYDRLKNFDQTSKAIISLLDMLHTESQYRYSYNRLKDSGYDLLSRFQNLDALMYQIDGFEFTVIESYLLHKTDFLSRFLQILFKQADNIRALNLSKNEHLLAIIKKIDTKLKHLSGQEQQSIKGSVTSFRGKLGNHLDANMQKRFAELDKYTVHSLTTRYKLLLENISNLFEDNALGRKFLREGFAAKLASAFYFPNLSNSIDKIRKMAEDRKEVKAQLMELHLADIFIHPGLLNKITGLDFKKISLAPEIKSSSDFVHALVKNIISTCSAFQLEVLYKPLLEREDLTTLQLYLRDEVTKEVRSRMSITKMMYSIASGNKKEYDHLNHIKKKAQKEAGKAST